MLVTGIPMFELCFWARPPCNWQRLGQWSPHVWRGRNTMRRAYPERNVLFHSWCTPSTLLNEEKGGTMERSNGQDRQPEVTVSEWEQRKDFVGLTDDDAQLLRDLRPIGEA